MARAASILVAEDDRALREAVASAVRGAGCEVAVVGDGAAAVRALRSATPDVVLLDIGLPFVDGWRVLAEIQGPSQPSVIIISARGDQEDKVRALDMGADDYLAKPFGTEELLARIRAVLRRAQPPAEAPRTITAGHVVVDLGRRAVLRDGVEVRLSPTEYVLIAELARHAHEVMDFRTLLQRVWGPAYADERHYLRVFIQRLRHKLEGGSSAPGCDRNGPRPRVSVRSGRRIVYGSLTVSVVGFNRASRFGDARPGAPAHRGRLPLHLRVEEAALRWNT